MPRQHVRLTGQSTMRRRPGQSQVHWTRAAPAPALPAWLARWLWASREARLVGGVPAGAGGARCRRHCLEPSVCTTKISTSSQWGARPATGGGSEAGEPSTRGAARRASPRKGLGGHTSAQPHAANAAAGAAARPCHPWPPAPAPGPTLRPWRRQVGVAAHQAAQAALQGGQQAPGGVAEALRLVELQGHARRAERKGLSGASVGAAGEAEAHGAVGQRLLLGMCVRERWVTRCRWQL